MTQPAKLHEAVYEEIEKTYPSIRLSGDLAVYTPTHKENVAARQGARIMDAYWRERIAKTAEKDVELARTYSQRQEGINRGHAEEPGVRTHMAGRESLRKELSNE